MVIEDQMEEMIEKGLLKVDVEEEMKEKKDLGEEKLNMMEKKKK